MYLKLNISSIIVDIYIAKIGYFIIFQISDVFSTNNNNNNLL